MSVVCICQYCFRQQRMLHFFLCFFFLRIQLLCLLYGRLEVITHANMPLYSCFYTFWSILESTNPPRKPSSVKTNITFCRHSGYIFCLCGRNAWWAMPLTSKKVVNRTLDLQCLALHCLAFLVLGNGGLFNWGRWHLLFEPYLTIIIICS